MMAASVSSDALPSVEEVPASLFKDHQGRPIHFNMKPCAERAKLKPYVVAGGGLLNYAPDTDQSICLVAPNHLATKNLSISSDYLWASLRARRMVSMVPFTVARGQQAPSGPVPVPDAEAAFGYGRQQGRCSYSAGEDAKIVSYLKELKNDDVKSLNRLCRDISKKTLKDRHSWESVKNRINRHIVPNLAFRVDSESRERILKLLRPARGARTSDSETFASSSASEEESEEKDAEELEREASEEEEKEKSRPGEEESEKSEDAQQPDKSSLSGSTTTLDSAPPNDLDTFCDVAAFHGLSRTAAVTLLWMASGQPHLAARILRRRDNPDGLLWTPESDAQLTSGSRQQVSDVIARFGEEAALLRLHFLEEIDDRPDSLEALAFHDS